MQFDMAPILQIDDDEFDAQMLKRAFNKLGIHLPLVHLEDAEEALVYLRQETNQRPSAIFLDLNMPNMGGFEFLEQLKKERALADIPVIVLSTSRDEEDQARSLALGAVEYVIKCVGSEGFVERIAAVQCYWKPEKSLSAASDRPIPVAEAWNLN